MPRAAEMEVLLCPTLKASYGLSSPLGKSAHAAHLPQRRKSVAPAGENLVGIGLMPDIPDDLVPGRIEDIVQRNGELDNAKARRQMAAGSGNGINHKLAYLCGKAGGAP